MLISGSWHRCDDEVYRPVIVAEVETHDGAWIKTPFLIDTGADRTVLSADIVTALNLPSTVAQDQLGGIGGVVHTILVETRLRLSRETGGKVMLRGQYAAVMAAEMLDMSVFGRDITNLFATIVDWPQQSVVLIGQRHRYTIVQQP